MNAGSQPYEEALFVYGLGRSGSAVVTRATQHGTDVSFYDARASGDDIEAALAAGARRLADVSQLDCERFRTCVAAPGVPVDHPDLTALRAEGVKVIGEVEWTWLHVPGRYVGVTGTAGKGSATIWLTEVLEHAGVEAIAGGNNDPALAAVARPGATHVVELSSFQLERCEEFRPDVAVMLNLGEDHIDRHGSVEAYHAAKRKLLENLTASDHHVFNRDDMAMLGWEYETPANRLAFSTHEPHSPAYYDPEEQTIYLEHRPLLHVAELKVGGEHQYLNALAVAAAALALGLSREQVAAGLPIFQGLRSRYETVARIGEITFIDDSIATRPLAVAAALRSTPAPCVWLAGGVSKGSDLSDLETDVAAQVDLLVAFGASGPELAERFSQLTDVSECRQSDGRDALRCAVRKAVDFLTEEHGAAGTVLLSPLAASFDQFKDYADRARVFREVVTELGAIHSARMSA